MLYAHVRNLDNVLLKKKDYEDNFDPASLSHKFGISFDVRIVPYYVDDDLPFDSDTQIQDESITIAPNEVRRIKTIRQLNAEELAIVADDNDRNTKRDSIASKIAVIRQWADDAESTTVTQGNAVTTLQTIVDRFGKLCDNLADLIEGRRLDK